MKPQSAIDYIDHILQAARLACEYVDGWEREQFFKDRRTQQAVILNLIVIGEAATRLMQEYPQIIERFPEVPWRSMKGMRNRIAHGYVEINVQIIWDTVRTALPALIGQLEALRPAQGNDGDHTGPDT